MAAVSYHFGSLKSLCDAAIADALERYLDAQHEAVSALGPESTLEELAAAFARPMIRALTSGGRDLAVMRIVARAGLDPPEEWDRLSARFDQIRADCVRVLKANVPEVSQQRAEPPYPLRRRHVELAGPRTGREGPRGEVREAARAILGPGARRRLPWRELTRRVSSSNISSRCLTRCHGPDILKQALDRIVRDSKEELQ